ncbi:MAG: carbohydrate ABC transporter permease [Deltaproteobacteria bacterium]
MLSRVERVVNVVILGSFGLVVLVPIVLTLLLALGPTSGSGGINLHSLHFSNFITAWNSADLGRGLLNSLIYSGGTVIGTAALCVPAGYAFATMRMPGGQVAFTVLLLGIMVPLTAVVVPLYYDFLSWHLSSTYVGLVLAHVGLSVSFGVFWMRSYFRSIPKSLFEAATLDGASRWTTLWRVCVPMGRSALFCLSLLVFMWTWNDYLLSLILIINNALQPAALVLGNFQQRYVTDYSLMAAGAAITAVPIVAVYLIFQRELIQGIFTGAVKA